MIGNEFLTSGTKTKDLTYSIKYEFVHKYPFQPRVNVEQVISGHRLTTVSVEQTADADGNAVFGYIFCFQSSIY